MSDRLEPDPAPTSGFWDDIVPYVDPARCRRCADCPPVAACPAQSFRRGRDGPQLGSLPVIDRDSCFGCYSCADACPHGAILRRNRMPRNR